MRVGGVFDPQLDTLRVALDSALTSPVGLAVAVSRETGRYLGVVDADQILTHVQEARAALEVPVGERAATGGGSGDQPAREPATPDVAAEDDAPADDAPADDAPADETRADKTPAVDLAADETPVEVAPAEETAAELALAPGMPAEVVAPENQSADDVPAVETSAAASGDPAPDEQVRS